MFLSISACIVAAVISYFLFFKKKRSIRQPPTENGGSFLFGYLKQFRADPLKFIQDCQKKHGNVFFLYGPMRLFKHLYIIGEEPVKMVLKSPDAKMSFEKGTGKILRAVLGPQKKEPNQETQDRLKRLAIGIKKSSKFNQRNIDIAINSVSSLFSQRGEFDIVDYLEDIVFHINISNFLGDKAMTEFERIKTLFIDLEHFGLQPLSIFAPFLPFGSPAKCNKIREEIKEMLKPYVLARRESGEEMDDYLSMWVKSPHVAGPKAGEEYDLDEILYEVVNIMFVSHVNTLVSTLWMLVFMTKQPEILEKTREELLQLRKEGKDLHQSEWLNMCTKETLRLTSIVDFLRENEDDFEYEGYQIKKGTTVRASAMLIHFDPVKYPNPFSFDPLRWKNNIHFSSEFSSFLAFGAGSHRCKGDTYALQIVKSVVGSLLIDWDYRFTSDLEKAEIDYVRLRKPKSPITMTISKKNL